MSIVLVSLPLTSIRSGEDFTSTLSNMRGVQRKGPSPCAGGRPFRCTSAGGPLRPANDVLRARLARGGALLHALGDNADLLDAGALGRIDDVDDVAVAQRAVGAD